MTRWNLTLAALAASLMLSAPAAARAAGPQDDAKLAKAAETAKTPLQHVDVAKQYRLRGEQFTTQAEKLEAEARRSEARPRDAMAYKWPGMVPQPWVKHRQEAMEARRAAKECLEAADRHMRLGVEALAQAAGQNTGTRPSAN